MQNLVFLIFLDIVASIQVSQPRSVNVALETVLEFDGKNDVDFIDTMQNFLKKLKTTITRSKHTIDQNDENVDNDKDTNKHFAFTDFLAKTITILRSYKDDDLKTFFSTLEREFKIWRTRKEFNEVTNQLGFRRIIERNLKSLKNSPVTEIRRKLNTLSDKLNLDNRNGNNGFFANFLNDVYKKEAEANLLNIFNNLKLYRSGTRRNMTHLKSIIRNGILTIIHPLLKLNSDTINNINTIYNEFIANNSDSNPENKWLKYFQKTENKPKVSRQKHKADDILRENKIFDYIDDHKRVIDEHLTTKKGFMIKTKVKSIPKILKTTGTTHKYIHTTRSKRKRNLKPKNSNIERVKKRPREKIRQWTLRPKVKKNARIDHEKDTKPVLIKLARNDNSELKSVEEYLSSTTKRQRHFKKSTRRKTTTPKPSSYFETTKKFRKAFRTTTVSAEGMSIEHFGSLFGREFHRKRNEDDKFEQTVLNSSVKTVTEDSIINKKRTDGITREMRKKNKLRTDDDDNIEENHDEMKNIFVETNNTSSIVENINDTEFADEKHDAITESIKIKGNIIIEKSTKATTFVETETTTSNPIDNNTTTKNFNVSIVTKYFNVKPMKPTIIFRRQHVETSNVTNVNMSTTSNSLQNTVPSAQTTNTSANNLEIGNININTEVRLKNTDKDGLDNEIDDVVEKTNATTIPVELEHFLKEVDMHNDDNKKVRDQMQADMEKLLAPPTTKSTVTELFTDPFDDIDEGADIL